MGKGECHETTRLLKADEMEIQIHQKPKKIHLFSCISVALSMMTGVGIFIFPNMVLKEVGSGAGSLLVWTGAGLVSLLAGLCYSELALALPGSGGELVYIQRVFGKPPATLFLLTSAFVKYPAISIIMTRSGFSYLVRCLDSGFCVECPEYQYILCLAGVAIIGLSCLMACYSTKLCTVVINALNFCKLSGIGLIITFAIYVVIKTPDKGEITSRFSDIALTTTHIPTLLLSVFGAIASYDGWNCLNLVAGEVYEPRRTMPLAITIATCLAIVFYILCNVAYLTVLPIEVMMESTAVALDLGALALGKTGQILLSLCVASSCLATILALAICNSRLLQSAAKDGQVPGVFKLNFVKTDTPIFSIMLHGCVCCVFALITSLQTLTTITVIVSWLFYMLCFISVLILRYKENLNPSFKVPGVIPVLLILFSLLLIAAPVTVSTGQYRASFIITVVLLLALTPVSLVSSYCSTSLSAAANLSDSLIRRAKDTGYFR